jgi:hypothetical protein
MIGSVIQYASLLVVWDEHGQKIGTISLNGGEMLGYSNSFVLLRYGNMIITTDANQRQFGSIVLPANYQITGITNNGFMARTGQTLQVYDQYCNHKGVQSI